MKTATFSTVISVKENLSSHIAHSLHPSLIIVKRKNQQAERIKQMTVWEVEGWGLSSCVSDDCSYVPSLCLVLDMTHVICPWNEDIVTWESNLFPTYHSVELFSDSFVTSNFSNWSLIHQRVHFISLNREIRVCVRSRWQTVISIIVRRVVISSVNQCHSLSTTDKRQKQQQQ